MHPHHRHEYQTFNTMIQSKWSIKLKHSNARSRKQRDQEKSSFKQGRTRKFLVALKVSATDKRYFVKSKFSRSLFISFAFTAKNTVISPNFLVWKFCGKAQFPHSFHTRKSGEITVFLAVV